MSGRSVLVVFPEWRLCVCRRSWHVSPVAETPGRPHVGSPVCGVLLLSVFVEDQQDIDVACIRRDRAQNL